MSQITPTSHPTGAGKVSGNLLILIELSLVFAVAFGWGFNELRLLKKYRKTPAENKVDHSADE